MEIQHAGIDVVYLGPETDPWRYIIESVCQNHPFLSFEMTGCLATALCREGAYILLAHASEAPAIQAKSESELSLNPVLFLATRTTDTTSGDWLLTSHDRNEIESIIIRSWVTHILNVQSASCLDAHEVVARAAHDLKSPLSAIISYCQVARRPDATLEEYRKYFARIESNARTADELIVRHMTDFRASRGKLRLQPVVTTLADWLVQDLCFEIESMTRKGLEFRCLIDPNVPEELLLDSFLLGQILKNLLDNAIKHTRAGSITVKACFLSQTETLQIDIIDSGQGINGGAHDAVFRLFEGAKTSEAQLRKARSLGIGLSNARSLARVMGGDVKLLDTSLSVGTTFRVEVSARRLSPTGRHAAETWVSM